MIIYSSKFKKNKEKYISKYCSDTKYTSRSINSIINNYKCSDYVYYITENNMDSHNIMSIIKNRPMDDGLSYYRLREDLSWEKFQAEPEDTPPISNEENQYTQELETALGIIGVEVN